jgi:hypothetical protein
VNERCAQVLEQVARERENQDALWGGLPHDDHHGANMWSRLISVYNGGYDPIFTEQAEKVKALSQRERWLKVAALAVAGIEWLDRTIECEECKGLGRINVGNVRSAYPDERHAWRECPRCGGATRVVLAVRGAQTKDHCEECGGLPNGQCYDHRCTRHQCNEHCPFWVTPSSPKRSRIMADLDLELPCPDCGYQLKKHCASLLRSQVTAPSPAVTDEQRIERLEAALAACYDTYRTWRIAYPAPTAAEWARVKDRLEEALTPFDGDPAIAKGWIR